MLSRNYALLYRPGLSVAFQDAWEDHKPEYTQFMKTGSTTSSEVVGTAFGAPARMYERGDGEPITYDYPFIGPKVVAVDKEYAAGFMMSRRALEDDQYGKLKNATKWLARGGRLTEEYLAAKFLDDAFSGSTYKGIDGQPLISNAHEVVAGDYGSGFSNTPAAAIPPTMAGFTAMMELYHNMKDDNGDPIVMWPDKIITSNITYYQKILAILHTDKEPFSAENQINAVKRHLGNMPDPILLHYTTNKNFWFMVDSKHNDAEMLTRRAIEFDSETDFDTEVTKWKASMRKLAWFRQFRGWVGSNPSS